MDGIPNPHFNSFNSALLSGSNALFKLQSRMKDAPQKYRVEHPFIPENLITGNNGMFVMPHYKVNDYEIRCMISDGLDWEHVSVTVAHKRKEASRCPTWEEMCWVKDLFWNEDEVVIQYHPAKADYVSMHPYCLHLWKPIGMILPTPDPLMVGVNLKK